MKFFENISFDKLKTGLSKTRDKLVTKINESVSGKAEIDEEVLEELEEALITSDIGYETSIKIIENTRRQLKSQTDRSKFNIVDTLKVELSNTLRKHLKDKTEYSELEKFSPYVIMVVGVNGAGKTTTIGKLAYNYHKAGLNVIIGSADTFRAAANEQLGIWAKRACVNIIESTTGNEPASVVYETLIKAKNTNADIVIIDTAGRLHTKNNLMEELKKIKNVMSKVLGYAPNEIFLVIDGNTGQNALIQAREFSKYTELTGLIVTKLDGTAKGGIMFQICAEQNIPVRYIGVGEGIEDLQTFDADNYVNALFQ